MFNPFVPQLYIQTFLFSLELNNSDFTTISILGDDFALDDDTSYLDEAVKAPDAPEREPGADSVATNQDGVLVDEFGLPKIPAQ